MPFRYKIDIIKMILNGRGKRIMMYNPQLETFLCVVEAGSFSKAAEKLYISAPAVIKQINSLEKLQRVCGESKWQSGTK